MENGQAHREARDQACGDVSADQLPALDDAALEEELRRCAAELAAGTARFLRLVAELDRRRVWERWECRSAADWLSWQCGVGPTAAREQVRVARRLVDLPLVAEELAAGRVSYSKVRAITRVCTPELQTELLELARAATAGQMERICRAMRQVDDRSREVEAADRAAVHWHRDHRTGELVGSFRLPAEDGEVFLNALDAALEGDPEESEQVVGADGEVRYLSREPADRRRARALAAVAAGFLAGDGPGRAEIVVHVDADAVMAAAEPSPPAPRTPSGNPLPGWRAPAGNRPPACTGRGVPVPPSALARLFGDAGVRVVAELADGSRLDLGRHARTVSPALFRALLARDRHCRFPGCTSTANLHAHHIVWWVHGGPTDRGNLILLCRKHHHAVHDRGWRCEGSARAVRFTDPRGRPVPVTAQRAGASAEALTHANRRHGRRPATTCGGRPARDRIDWDCLFAALGDRFPLPREPEVVQPATDSRRGR